jgi:hypothetical protein
MSAMVLLLLSACTSDADLQAMPGRAPTPPAEHTLAMSNLVAGELAVFDIIGASSPVVELAMSTTGLGAGPCPAAFGGECFDLAGVVRRTGFTANVRPSGNARGGFTVPMRAAGAYLAFQAVDGPGALSNPVARPVGAFGVELTDDGDLDNDGFTILDGDCADFDAAFAPGVVDMVLDGIDQDCDDLDGTDADGDGYLASEGGGDDCDDSDVAISPAGIEVCGGVDEDCDGTADDGVDCYNLVLDGASRHYADGTVASSCKEYINPTRPYQYAGATGDGLYLVNPNGTGSYAVYCDMTTEGGGWTLMAKFSQHQRFSSLPDATYNAYFRNALWIEGVAEARPSSPVAVYDNYHIESVDWRKHLTTGAPYSLRMQAYKGAGTAGFDLAYDFTHNGYVKQNGAPDGAKSWALTNRRDLANASGITWHTPSEQVRFWLPFHVGMSGLILTACNGFDFSTAGCQVANSAARRYGNAGIIGATADGNDPAASWAPHANATTTFDVAFVHQGSGAYGASGAQMALLYWIR